MQHPKDATSIARPGGRPGGEAAPALERCPTCGEAAALCLSGPEADGRPWYACPCGTVFTLNDSGPLYTTRTPGGSSESPGKRTNLSATPGPEGGNPPPSSSTAPHGKHRTSGADSDATRTGDPAPLVGGIEVQRIEVCTRHKAVRFQGGSGQWEPYTDLGELFGPYAPTRMLVATPCPSCVPEGAVVYELGRCGRVERASSPLPDPHSGPAGLARRGAFTVAESDARAEYARLVADADLRARARLAAIASGRHMVRVLAEALDREVPGLKPERAEQLGRLVAQLLDLADECEMDGVRHG